MIKEETKEEEKPVNSKKSSRIHITFHIHGEESRIESNY